MLMHQRWTCLKSISNLAFSTTSSTYTFLVWEMHITWNLKRNLQPKQQVLPCPEQHFQCSVSSNVLLRRKTWYLSESVWQIKENFQVLFDWWLSIPCVRSLKSNNSSVQIIIRNFDSYTSQKDEHFNTSCHCTSLRQIYRPLNTFVYECLERGAKRQSIIPRQTVSSV